MRLRSIGAAAAVAVALLVLAPAPASAHPLGNFTVNRYSGLVVGTSAVRVDHVQDLAEVPTAQRMRRIDESGDGSASASELTTFATDACGQAAQAMRLTLGGSPRRLSVSTANARLRDGQAGLPSLRLTCTLVAQTGGLTERTEIRLEDRAADDEVGWREMTARGDRTTLERSDVPSASRSARLTSYPPDLLSSPLDVRSAAVLVRPGGPALGVSADPTGSGVPTTAGVDRLTEAFQGLVQRYDGSPLLALVGLLVALALGAGHALAPGHGKTVMAFYLGSRRERAARDAMTVAATVTLTHTAGVLLLGILVSAGTGFVPARLYPYLSVASGLLVALVGLGLLREARGGHRHSHPHPHEHADAHPHPHRHPHDNADPHPHTHANAHTHPDPHSFGDTHPHPHRQPVALKVRGTAALEEPEVRSSSGHETEPIGARPASRRSVVAIGLAGGLLPSPSAVLVFLSAIAAGHAWFGVVLVATFGLGMAGTLTAAGVLVMRLRDRAELRVLRRGLEGRPSALGARLLSLAPLLTATAVVVLGVVIASRGAAAIGM